MNQVKRLTSALIVFLFCFTFFINTSLAGENNGEKLNVIFVMDASKSMLKSDPQNIREDAARLFIDMCRGKGDSIGLTAYGSKIVKTVEPKSIKSFEDRENLKNLIKDVPGSESTDIGLGIIDGIKNLEKGAKDDGIPIIILISDGRNDPERALEESNRDITNALIISREKGYRIYTIGLNANGKVDVNLLKRIADETKGKAFIINSARDLPLIFGEIFADSSQLKMLSKGNMQFSGDFQNVEIDIPNSNVVEANISIMSQSKIELRITDNKGNIKNIPSDNLYYSYLNKYSLVKLLSPEQGRWVLGIKGEKGQSADISLIYNYELGIDVAKIPDKEYKPSDALDISAYLTSNGQKLEDKAFYNGLSGKIIIKNEKGDLVGEFKMENLSNEFKGTCKISSGGSFKIIVRIDGTSFYRETTAAELNIPKSQQTV